MSLDCGTADDTRKIFVSVNITFVPGKANYLNINFKFLKKEGTQAFLNVLKMKLGRV